MFPKFCFLLILLGLTVPPTFAQWCPYADVIFPCECDNEWMDITCDGRNYPNLDIKEVFDRVSPLIGDDVVFNNLNIRYFNRAELPANSITSVKFNFIYIYDSPFLERIHPDAFNATYDVTKSLEIRGNSKLTNRNNSYDNFEFITRFKRVGTLALGGSAFKSIPSEPFGSESRPFNALYFGSCQDGGLDSVGSRFLANLPSMGSVDLKNCNLTEHKFAPDSFEGIGSRARLFLENNQINTLPEAVFKPVLDTVGNWALMVGGQECPGEGQPCTRLRLDCDQTSAWLCEHQAAYELKIEGFYCREPVGWDIWDWCAENFNANATAH